VYFFVLFFIQRSKKFFSTPARAEMPWFRALMGLANMSPLLGIILASVYAWSLKSSDGGDYYSSQLSIVGSLSSVNTPDLFRVPSFKYPWGALFQDSLTVTVLLFYEGYAIAWKYARANNELSYLNPSQELFAVGAANMVGSMTSAFPVSGSFTRSAVGVEVGGRSPFVSLTCALLAVLVLYVLSPYLQYTPYSALAALIYVSLYNNLGLTEAYEAMRASPSDALAWIATFLVTFIVDTSIGLLAGIIVSFAAFLYVAVFSANNFPEASDIGPESNGVKLIRLNCDLSFLSVARMRDSFVEELFVNDGLQVMIVDFIDVKHIDLSAVKALRDIQLLADELKVKFITANVAPHITEKLHDFEIFLEGKGGGGGSEGKLVVRLKRGLEKYKNVKSFMNHRVAEELDLSKSLGALSAGSGLSTSSRRQGRFSLTRLASSLNDSLRGSRKGLGNSSSKSLRWKASNRPTQPFIPISYLAEKEKSLRSRKTVDKLSSDV
jgi:MFS superfamily sulfate permease-like transporter